MYRMDTELSLILLVSEMLKIPRPKAEAHFLAFVTNKCLAQDAFGQQKRQQGEQKTFQNTQQYANSYEHKFSYHLVYSTELFW